jgi:hypothetical protein
MTEELPLKMVLSTAVTLLDTTLVIEILKQNFEASWHTNATLRNAT